MKYHSITTCSTGYRDVFSNYAYPGLLYYGSLALHASPSSHKQISTPYRVLSTLTPWGISLTVLFDDFLDSSNIFYLAHYVCGVDLGITLLYCGGSYPPSLLQPYIQVSWPKLAALTLWYFSRLYYH